MKNTVRSTAVRAAGAAGMALGVGIAGLFGSAIASANSGHEAPTDVKVVTPTPPQMQLSASAGEQIRATGTQGAVATANQCTDISTVKVSCVTSSLESVPQPWSGK